MSVKDKSRFYRGALHEEVYVAVMEYSEDILFKEGAIGGISIYIESPKLAGWRARNNDVSQLTEITPLLLSIYLYDFKDGGKRCLTKIRLNGVTKTLGPIYLDKHEFMQFCTDAARIYVKIIEDGIKKDKTKHTCCADVSKYYDDSALIDLCHKFKQNHPNEILKYLYYSNEILKYLYHPNEILKYLFKKTERLEAPDPATERYYVGGFSMNHYAVKFYNTYSEVKTYTLYKSQYDYWLENQDKLNKYTSDLFLPLSPECSDLERLRLHNPDGYSRFIKTHLGRKTLSYCPSRHNEKGELISSLDIPIWAKFNTWSIIGSSVNESLSKKPSLLHSKICITKNGLDYAHFSVRDFVLDNDINLSVFKTDNQLPFEAPVYLMQINIFNPKSSVPCVYHFDAFCMLDLNRFSLSVSAIYCGDYVINDLFYEDTVHPLNLKYYEAHKAADSVVPKLFKYDETYPSTPEEALDSYCRERNHNEQN